MDAIAARAGVGKNTIYRRWASKEDLIADALHELTAELDVELSGDTYPLLLELIREFSSVFSEPVLGRILPGLLAEAQRNPALAAAYADRVVRPRRQAVVRLIRLALERGELRADADPEQIADLLVGPLFLRLFHPLGLPELPDGYGEDLLDTIWRGIKPASSNV